MDRGYEIYCMADRWFYESPLNARADDADFEPAQGKAPAGWRREAFDDWLSLIPDGARVPTQGWKVHASACVDNAAPILDEIWAYCIARRIPFKFVRSRQLLFLRNVKYAPRDGSGKFATIYPADEAQLEAVLTELGERLDGQPGPYILSDLRWGSGPLYVRYGGFRERHCVGADGELELAIEDATGRLVPDTRGATFQVPDWVALPACLEPHLAARNAATVQGLPYRIDGALHFSNGGGLYHGVDLRSDEPVVLKEARPHAGLSVDGADAVARLAVERAMLARLSGLDVVPGLRDHVVLGEHHFLVQDRVEGDTLDALIVERYPLVCETTDAATAAAYADWALTVHARVERAVAKLHERGVVIGDLHPSNVLVRPDGSVVLIDLEVATGVDDARRPTLADPAFIAPEAQTGLAVDRYALACLRLYLFLPLTALLGFDVRKAEDLAAAIAQAFPVPRGFLSEAVDTITSAGGAAARDPERPPMPLEPTPEGWRAARASMAAAILASATPERDDRLFPGDVKQFHTNGLNLSYGAAGVLYALHEVGAGRHPEHEAWLVERARDPRPGMRLGFYDGLHGVAYVLDRLGRRDDALSILAICSAELDGKWSRLRDDLAGGLSGIALNLAHFARATGDRALWERVWTIADIVAERLGGPDDVARTSGGDQPYAGLMRGSSGPALLFLRLYEETGEKRLLDLAATAIGQDLRRCVPVRDDALEVDEGWRTMPYLADGSVGIGIVLADYLAHRHDERFAAAAGPIHRAALGQFYIEPGLMYGRAGVMLYLARASGNDAALAAHVRRLRWHALSYEGRLAFPGEFLLRLSMDLASGSAGVLLALGAALHEAPVGLPFFSPVDDPHPIAPARGPLIATMEGR